MSKPLLGKLLIVDDESQLLNTLVEMLTEEGYEATGLDNGFEALEALKRQDFDILLSDLMMPGIDGITLMQSALEIDKHLITIIMTGQATVQTAVGALKGGAFDYILKPFKLNAILQVLSRGVTFRRLRLENLQLRDTVAIYELGTANASTLDLNIILEKLASAALEQCEADEAAVMLPTERGDQLYVAATRGGLSGHAVGELIAIDRWISNWIAGNSEPAVLQRTGDEKPESALFERPDMEGEVAIPMQAGGEFVGILKVSSVVARRPFAPGQIKALNVLASTGAAALKNALLYEELRTLNATLDKRVAARTAELVGLNKELEAFSYSISHDLRRPLGSVRVFSQKLVDDYADRLDEEGRRCLRGVVESAGEMGQLIDSLASLSAATHNEMSVGKVDLTELAKDSIAELQRSAGERQIAFVAQENVSANGDSQLLRMAIGNLLGSSWKSSAAAPSQIEFGAILQDDQTIYFIKDDGAGFNMAGARRLSGAVQSMEAWGDAGGIGIELTTAQRIIQRHRGRVWAEGEEGRGTTFYFTLNV
ncbi:MAG TPA: response regulator [Blastocatellia bacterium]|nr:response regulator [Blastocatellia bacterium]